MVVGALTWLYERLGRSYPAAFLAVELQSALLIAAAALGLFSFYYDGSSSDYLLLLAITLGLTLVATLFALLRSLPRLRPIERWISGHRDPEATAQAWAAAVGLPLATVKRALPTPVFVTVVPICIAGVLVLGLSWLAFFPLMLGATIVVGYAAILHYLALETGMRPVLVDINQQLAPRVSANVSTVPLRWRLILALPLINLITGFVVAALTSDGGGGENLGVDVLIAVAVATTISLELTIMLSKSILRPIDDLSRAVEAVGEGDFDVSVPVTTGDELGELIASFNQMVEGLRERERLREAFGTYLDREVAEHILSEGFSEEGEEVEISVLFCDVRDFTAFAAEATPKQVVAALNRLFEVIVPVIARHGGHVDKFEGDGLLAMFGAPEPYPDHAERAVRAACEIAKRINRDGAAGELRVGVGVNTGTVVAGAIGGAGRLNFSVIGAAVNIAARVEAATRETGDEVLITAETWQRLSSGLEAEHRGRVELRGIEEPVALYAPRLAGAGDPGRDGAGPSAGAEDGDLLAGLAGRLRSALRR